MEGVYRARPTSGEMTPQDKKGTQGNEAQIKRAPGQRPAFTRHIQYHHGTGQGGHHCGKC